MSENKGGRPPKFKSQKDLKARIERYFRWCEGEPLIDETTGKPVVTKSGIPVYIGVHPPTIVGLANALDVSRQTLLNYQGKRQFEEIITKAKRRVEQYAEERLYDKDGSAGARFNLQNNFKGWKNETEVTLNAAEGQDIMAEIRTRMAAEAFPDEGGQSVRQSRTEGASADAQRQDAPETRDPTKSWAGGDLA